MTTPEATRFLAFPDEMKTIEGAKSILEETIQAYNTDKPLFALAIEAKGSGTFLGCCGANSLSSEGVEIFCGLMPIHWKKGMGTEVCKSLISYLFEEHDIQIVKGFIVPSNKASIYMVEKIGFRNTGLVENPNFTEKVYKYEIIKGG